MAWRYRLIWSLGALLGGLTAALPAQTPVTGKAALTAVPYWWRVAQDPLTGVIPLLWTNEVDGSGAGCCVVGAGARFELPQGAVWFGAAFGIDGDAGAPAALEAAAELEGRVLVFRSLHGRTGFWGLYPLVSPRPTAPNRRVSIGLSALWLNDERYLESVPFFECSTAGPAVPCREIDTPYPWSSGSDHALLAEAEWGRGDPRSPRITAHLLTGLKLAGGDHDYLRLEFSALAGDSLGRVGLDGRLGGGWASGDAPLQRRFHLDGADPVGRWLNPYVDVPGAVLAGAPYVVPGGPNLWAYHVTRPLVRSYVSLLAQARRSFEMTRGIRGELGVYAAGAWLPDMPDRLGPEALNEDGDFLFDWQELPVGEGEALGRFRARVLETSRFWADAGLKLSADYDRVGVTLVLPLWASEPAFADEPITGEEKTALALRWAFWITFRPAGGLQP